MADTLSYGGRPVVICPVCEQDINAVGVLSCVPNDAHPFGSEPVYPRSPNSNEECRDCSVTIGGYHHGYCCVAQCAVCDDQWICCDHSPDLPDPIDPSEPWP